MIILGRQSIGSISRKIQIYDSSNHPSTVLFVKKKKKLKAWKKPKAWKNPKKKKTFFKLFLKTKGPLVKELARESVYSKAS